MVLIKRNHLKQTNKGRIMIKAVMEEMKILWWSVVLVCGFSSACFGEERSIFMVLLEGGSPVAFHGPSQALRRAPSLNSELSSKAHAMKLVESHDQILESSLEMGTYTKLYSFNHILNGFAVHTTPSQAKALKNAAKVKLVERDRGVKLMTTYTPEFLGLAEGRCRRRREKGGERKGGEGIVIGFVDSGINPSHPSFAFHQSDPLIRSNLSKFCGHCEAGPRFPSSSCNGKIVSARFFSAGAEAIATLNSSLDFLSTFDADGHGSHVASTAAGNAGVPVVVNGYFYGLASGMAPRARIAVYKAIYPTVGTLSDVIAAVDQAARDGVDILTLSVGPDEPPEDTSTLLSIFEIVLLFARKAGILVVQAAGNHGPATSTVVSYSPWAVGVGASTTDRIYPSSLLLGNGFRVSGVGLSRPSFGLGLLLYKLVLAKDAGVKGGGDSEECQSAKAFDPEVVRGSIVICSFSGGFYNQSSSLGAIIETSRTLGFVGFVLIANSSYGSFVAEPIPFSVPGILIPNVDDAQAIMSYYEEQNCRDERGVVRKFEAEGRIGDGRRASFGGEAPAPVVSRFSSRGPDFIDVNRTPIDVLKPDVLAPGHQIWAAWTPMSASEPLLKGNHFALLSGTSMATPHVAGLAAVIKQNHPSWNPSMIASAMATTAANYANNGDHIMAEGFSLDTLFPSTPFDVGSGFIDPTRAMDPGLVLMQEFEDYINFLCSIPEIDGAMVKTSTGEECNGSISTNPADLNLPSVTISSLVGSQLVKRRVTNVGDKVEMYVSSVVPPNGTTVTVTPPSFTIYPHQNQYLTIQINVTETTGDFSFGEIVLTGSLNHIVRLPVSILAASR